MAGLGELQLRVVSVDDAHLASLFFQNLGLPRSAVVRGAVLNDDAGVDTRLSKGKITETTADTPRKGPMQRVCASVRRQLRGLVGLGETTVNARQRVTQQGMVRAVAWHPFQQRVAMACADGSVRFLGSLRAHGRT